MRARIEHASRAHRPLLLSADVFDASAQPVWLDEFLGDKRHHLVIATVADACVGFASAVHYLHPDKAPQMWINEVGVNEAHRRQGIATRLIAALNAHARTLGCTEMWVLADPTEGALGLYESLDWCRTGTHVALFSCDLGQKDG